MTDTTATIMDFPLTLDHLLDRAAQLFPKVEVVSQMPDKSLRRHDYAALRRRARALAKGLLDAGLRPGERVATLMWNHYAHLEAYFGVPLAGGVYHTLNLRLSPGDLTYITNHAQDRFLIVDDVLLPLLKTFEADAPFEKVFVVRLSGAEVPEPYIDYEALLTEVGEDWQSPPLREEMGAGMCYTSGTTGRPKGVIYSHRAIVLHSFASAMVDTLALSQRDTVVPMVPMFHANCWGLPFTATLVGAKQVHPGPHLDPESLLDLYQKERATCSAGVPTVWLGIQQLLEANPGRWKLEPDLRMVVGGSAAPESMIRAMDELGLRVIHAWGMTETAPLGSVAALKATMRDASEDEQYRVRATQGVPVPFVDVRAVSEKGEVPWDGKTMGELQVRGPWVASSYYADESGDGAAPDKWTADGWFRTGDVVTIDAEGYIKITDRTKDLIKSGGEWISSVELENALMGHPAIREAAVVALPHEKWVERPLAAIVLRDGQTAPSDEALAEYLLAKGFAKWWLPEGYVVRDEIPRTSTGKFLKAALREQLASWQPS
ncbi:long-chain fatty acid--CoA ligase [Pseudenhygromyxa sp. WMMC2535]|uniref:long-chain fatty acid--CoA ligase n=1 Tax=Pseudenhygromyxa sp. WMMC2535 TaxID=2712867 RepID=UPI001552F013|nr:long-chain fatty acid--CoA ligase [Pseudenhygromyxa sp. WMMC2535]NVB36696.1 long-chain fatty acid--CoA ligase [Pseudenhygromyxa sp. WMMC2535]